MYNDFPSGDDLSIPLSTLIGIDDRSGLRGFKKDLRAGKYAFCLCEVASKYHIGVEDAGVMLDRHVKSGALVKMEEGDLGLGEIIYVNSSERPTRRVLAQIAQIHAGLKKLVQTLSDAFDIPYEFLASDLRDYHGDQPSQASPEVGEVLRRIVNLFETLQSHGLLPATTKNTRFNHMGMLKIMLPVFGGDHERLGKALQTAAPIKDNIPELRQLLDRRLRLLDAIDAAGNPTEEQSLELARIDEQISKAEPPASDLELLERYVTEQLNVARSYIQRLSDEARS